MMLLDPELTTEFVGYDNMEAESEVTALTSEEEIVDALSDGEKGTVIVARLRFMQQAVDRKLIKV